MRICACYSSPKVDELIGAGASEPDPDQRRRICAQVQSLIHQDAPSIWLYVPQENKAVSARVHNWEPSPDSRINLHKVWLSDKILRSAGAASLPGRHLYFSGLADTGTIYKQQDPI